MAQYIVLSKPAVSTTDFPSVALVTAGNVAGAQAASLADNILSNNLRAGWVVQFISLAGVVSSLYSYSYATSSWIAIP